MTGMNGMTRMSGENRVTKVTRIYGKRFGKSQATKEDWDN